MKALYTFLLILFPACLMAQNIDINLLKKINPANPRSNFWAATSHSAYWVPPAAAAGNIITGIIKKDRKLRVNGYQVIINTVVSAGVSEALKQAFNRNRPAETYPGIVFPAEEKTGRSFPSGHTIMAFATATSLALQYKKWYVAVPAYAWASAVGYSRLYRGVHYPSDALAGAAIGVGTGYFSHWLTRKIFNKNQAKETTTLLYP